MNVVCKKSMTLQQLRELLKLLNGAMRLGCSIFDYIDQLSENRQLRLAKVFGVEVQG